MKWPQNYLKLTEQNNDLGRKRIYHITLTLLLPFPLSLSCFFLPFVYLAPEIVKLLHWFFFFFSPLKSTSGGFRQNIRLLLEVAGLSPCGKPEIEFIFVCFMPDVFKVQRVPQGLKVNA